MDYYELNCKVQPLEPFREIIISELADHGFESFEETPEGFKAYIPVSGFSKEEIGFIMESHQEAKIEFSEKLIPGQNWNEEWERNFQPIRIGESCVVRAPFHNPAGVPFELIIQPQMSFGTGHHETTSLMLAEMLQIDFSDKKVLDMGCGTGVLAILASMKKASKILAVDIDDWAVNNTIENLELNKIDNVDVIKGDSSVLAKRDFNIILANINKNILLADIPLYSKSLLKGGKLLISGFFVTDKDELIRCSEGEGLTFSHAESKNNWAMLCFVKKD